MPMPGHRAGARHGVHDFACEGRAACERMGGGQPGQYRRVVHIVLDRRIFTPTPYGSPSWKRGS